MYCQGFFLYFSARKFSSVLLEGTLRKCFLRRRNNSSKKRNVNESSAGTENLSPVPVFFLWQKTLLCSALQLRCALCVRCIPRAIPQDTHLEIYLLDCLGGKGRVEEERKTLFKRGLGCTSSSSFSFVNRVVVAMPLLHILFFSVFFSVCLPPSSILLMQIQPLWRSSLSPPLSTCQLLFAVNLMVGGRNSQCTQSRTTGGK